MNIHHTKLTGRGAFTINVDGKCLAEMTYAKNDDSSINIDHTQVDDSLRGQRVGDELLAEAAKYAREEGLTIAATCSFALRKLQENADFADIFAG